MAWRPCLVFVILLALVSIIHGFACRRNADCNDGLDCTTDFCSSFGNDCFNIPKHSVPANCNGNAQRSSTSLLKDELDASPLSPDQRAAVIDVATVHLRDLHPHRELQLNVLSVDPAPALSRLREEVLQVAAGTQAISETEFHQRIIRIFNSVDDLHTVYFAPAPLRNSFAFLPFRVREFYPRDPAGNVTAADFIVDDIALDHKYPHLVPGVRIVSWNGAPIAEAVRASGEAGFGNNPSARLVRGLQRLTFRVLASQELPEKRFVGIGFIDLKGRRKDAWIPWTFGTVPPALASDLLSLPDQDPTDPSIVNRPLRESIPSSSPRRVPVAVKSTECESLAADIVTTSQGPLGVITLFNFLPFNRTEFFSEVVRLLSTSLPQNGVVIDLRSNLGGFGEICQSFPQLFTTSPIVPVQIRLRNQRLVNIASTRLPNPFESEEARAIRIENGLAAIRIGDQFLPSTDGGITDLVNSFPAYNYLAPVVLLTSAESYSCAEAITSNFIDNGIGLVIGVDDTTGGGGSIQTDTVQVPVLLPEAGTSNLPTSVFFRSSFIRLERVLGRRGTTWEFFGVPPQLRYFRTKRDLLDDDVDLFEIVANQIAKMRKA